MRFKDNYVIYGLLFFLIIVLAWIGFCLACLPLGWAKFSDPYYRACLWFGAFGLAAFFFTLSVISGSVTIEADGIYVKRPYRKKEFFSWDQIVDSGVRHRQAGLDGQFMFYFATFSITEDDHYCRRKPKDKYGKGERIFDIACSENAVKAIKLYCPQRIKDMIHQEAHKGNKEALNAYLENLPEADRF
jgi:hypothetical protein